MPFRHVAMYRWAAHVGPEHVDRVRAALDELASLVPGVQQHVHGSDVGVSEGAFDYLVVADFDTVADWRTYRDHPAHVLLEVELLDGHVAERASGQYQLTNVRDTDEPSASRRRELSAASDPDPSGGPTGESDAELLARARRAAQAEMDALLAEPDDVS